MRFNWQMTVSGRKKNGNIFCNLSFYYFHILITLNRLYYCSLSLRAMVLRFTAKFLSRYNAQIDFINQNRQDGNKIS